MTTEELVQNGNGAMALLKWWPVLTFLVGWGVIGFGGFFQLRAELMQVKAEVASHERVQADATEEQNRRLATIEADVKELLKRR